MIYFKIISHWMWNIWKCSWKSGNCKRQFQKKMFALFSNKSFVITVRRHLCSSSRICVFPSRYKWHHCLTCCHLYQLVHKNQMDLIFLWTSAAVLCFTIKNGLLLNVLDKTAKWFGEIIHFSARFKLVM